MYNFPHISQPKQQGHLESTHPPTYLSPRLINLKSDLQLTTARVSKHTTRIQNIGNPERSESAATKVGALEAKQGNEGESRGLESNQEVGRSEYFIKYIGEGIGDDWLNITIYSIIYTV